MDGPSTSALPTSEENNLGAVTNAEIHSEILLQESRRKNKKNAKFTPDERFKIGEYTAIHGPVAAIRKFKRTHPHITLCESTTRNLKKKYLAKMSKSPASKEITSATRGPKLMLGEMDEKILKYLELIRRKGGVVSIGIANAVAKAMISRSDCAMLKSIDIENSCWAKSLMQRSGWVRRKQTTGKPPLPKGVVEEAGIIFLHQVVQLVEKYRIPPSMIINIDQTPMKYAPVANFTLNKRGEKDISISGVDYKKAMTATFAITLDGKFLPMQLIYGGKTSRSLPNFKFPDSFSLSFNEKHYSNTEETIKLIDEILTPYLDEERTKLGLEPDHKGLVVMDAFKGQSNDIAYTHFDENNIKIAPVPANMTSHYQPADLTVNGPSKGFMKLKFSSWYADEIGKGLDGGENINNIEVPLRLSGLKPLHASWLVELYDYLTSSRGKEIILNGWSRAGIAQAIRDRSSSLPSLDPFQEIDPMEYVVSFEEHLQYVHEDRNYAVCYVTENDGEEDKSDGTADEIYYLESLQEDLTELDDVDDDRNIFDVFDDEVSDDEEEEDISGERADN